MKKIYALCMVLMLSAWVFSPVFAQWENAPTLLESDVRSCEEHEMDLSWPKVVKKEKEITYSVKSSVPWSEVASIVHEIRNWSDVITTYESSKWTHAFSEKWRFLVKTLLTTNDWCTYVAQESVEVYDRVFLYIGPWSDEYGFVKDSLQQDDVHLWTIKIVWDSLQQQDQVVETLIDNKDLIESSDVLFIDSQALWVVLWALPDVEKFVPIDLWNANVYVLSSINQSAFRRLIATYRSLVWLKEINVIPQNNVSSLVSALLLDKNPEELWMVKKFRTDTGSSSNWLIVSNLVDKLLRSEMPLQFLVFLLLVPIIVLVITFFRQVVWFTIFGVASTLLIAVAITTIWTIPTVIIISAWWLAVLTTNMITERVYVLVTPKIALQTSIFSLLLIVLFVIQHRYWFEILDNQLLSNPYLIFLIFYCLIASSAIFKNPWTLFKKKWFIWVIQWSLVVLTIVWILRWSWLHNVLLGYPELVILALLCLFIVWRYTWLQVTEYFRFMPLIVWSMKDHEEEE